MKQSDLNKFFKIELQKRERYMVIAATLFSLFAFYNYAYTPLSKANVQIKNQIDMIKKKEVENERTLSDLQIKSSKMMSVNKVVPKEISLDTIKSPNNMSKLLQSVVDGAKNEIFHLKKITLESSLVENKIRKSRFNIELNSSFLGLSKFLDQVEKNSNWLAIENVTLNRIEKDLRECDGAISITTYEVLGEES